MAPANTTRRTLGENATGWLFVSPWLVGLLLLFVYPFAASLYWSFCRYDLLQPPEPVGLDNYRELAGDMAHGGPFRRALLNTIYYAGLAVPGTVMMGLGLALVLRYQQRWQVVSRTAVYLPSVLPTVATAVLWMWLLDPSDGIVNRLLAAIGGGQPNWFRGVSTAFWPPGLGDFGSKDALVLMTLWASGNWIVIYLAALHQIPQSLYEAASMDGAGSVRQFWHVTLPSLSPVIFFNVVMGLIQSVQFFTPVYIVSEGTGQPADASLLLSLQLFLNAFQDLRMGLTSAVAWVLFVVLATLTYGLFRSSRYWVHAPS